VDAARDGCEGRRRREAIGPGGRIARAELPLEPGHADHEELVEVRAEDGEEFHPLEEGHARVLRLFEDAPVELEPGELPIDQIRITHGAPFPLNVSRRRIPSRTPKGADREDTITAEHHQLFNSPLYQPA
jgi:hypothetical protein